MGPCPSSRSPSMPASVPRRWRACDGLARAAGTPCARRRSPASHRPRRRRSPSPRGRRAGPPPTGTGRCRRPGRLRPRCTPRTSVARRLPARLATSARSGTPRRRGRAARTARSRRRSSRGPSPVRGRGSRTRRDWCTSSARERPRGRSVRARPRWPWPPRPSVGRGRRRWPAPCSTSRGSTRVASHRRQPPSGAGRGDGPRSTRCPDTVGRRGRRRKGGSRGSRHHAGRSCRDGRARARGRRLDAGRSRPGCDQALRLWVRIPEPHML